MNWAGTVTLDRYLTTTEAAEYATVTPEVIRKWKQRGLLHLRRRTAEGRPLYLALDVLETERATRRSGKSRRA